MKNPHSPSDYSKNGPATNVYDGVCSGRLTTLIEPSDRTGASTRLRFPHGHKRDHHPRPEAR